MLKLKFEGTNMVQVCSNSSLFLKKNKYDQKPHNYILLMLNLKFVP